ncbi:hypothetical protein [Caenispirillum bisanense]|uniref:Uncharacterized protein n=1 Tax=Caenispirillum bisanense TaxID=414052 RepID=A0A286GVH3_9PROT|nr:hypothetical protein [Caenispirillum bisanense]SOD99500.1 hypothetical protein SAMN05421508_10934 [Caenispirillum bisanense]
MHRAAAATALSLTVALAAVTGADARAADAAFPGVAPVAAAELGGVRGGMRIGDFDIDIGIALRTSVDGTPVLTSSLGSGPDGFVAVSDGIPAGGFDVVARSVGGGLEVAHTLGGIPATTIRNTLNRLAIDQLVTVDITVRNFHDRIDTVRSRRIADGALRQSMTGR